MKHHARVKEAAVKVDPVNAPSDLSGHVGRDVQFDDEPRAVRISVTDGLNAEYRPEVSHALLEPLEIGVRAEARKEDFHDA